MNKNKYLAQTKLLDFNTNKIQQLIGDRGWNTLNPYLKIQAVYSYVRDEIKFGYNDDDNISASHVLNDGYGQCNTKGILLMALLRGIGIPCRFHGFTIFNELQKGAIPEYIMPLAPAEIVHSWVEVYYNGGWIELEGFILDQPYLSAVQNKYSHIKADFSGYGIATKCLSNPPINWSGKSTYIQSEGIAHDFGIFDSPDDFFTQHGSNLSGIKRLLYKYLVRHLMNRNVTLIRKSTLSKSSNHKYVVKNMP
ncbi:MAG: transglutaminase-like domain-containing protein [Chloroflexota bacterium]